VFRTNAMLVAAGLAASFCVADAGWAHAPAQLMLQVIRDQPLPLPGDANRREDAATAVQFLSPEQVTVPARRAAQIDLHFRVANGLHINSHAPLEKSLIPARLAVVEVQGLNVTAVDFPPGTEYALQFSPREKLSVYTGEFVLHAHVTAQPGEHLLAGALRYQACDSNSCMPPHSIPVSVTVVAQ
jgi:Disulphide bond corrector protein DsbC